MFELFPNGDAAKVCLLSTSSCADDADDAGAPWEAFVEAFLCWDLDSLSPTFSFSLVPLVAVKMMRCT